MPAANIISIQLQLYGAENVLVGGLVRVPHSIEIVR